VSPAAVSRCREIFRSDSSKRFKLMDEYAGETAEITLSLDVVYHLVEDDVFESYMYRLFNSSQRFAVIYSSNSDEQPKLRRKHRKHRKFTDWVERNIHGWRLVQHIPNRYPFRGVPTQGSRSDFYIYERTSFD
jgi:hypothetical protein